MPTQELHQEREQRSFQEVQQYFMRTVFANQGGQYGPVPQSQGQHGGRPHNNYQGQRQQNQGNRQGGNFKNRGNRYNMRQGGSREGYQAQQQQQQPASIPPQQQPQAAAAHGQAQMTPDQAQLLAQQQQMMAQQQMQ